MRLELCDISAYVLGNCLKFWAYMLDEPIFKTNCYDFAAPFVKSAHILGQ